MTPILVGLGVAAVFVVILVIQRVYFSEKVKAYQATEADLSIQFAQLQAKLREASRAPGDSQQLSTLENQIANLQAQLRNKDQEIQRLGSLQTQASELQKQINQKAQELHQTWMQKDREGIAAQQREISQAEAKNQLEQWKAEAEAQIRTDAIQRSQSVTLGKVTEHLAPYMPDFSFNPKDVRFIGSPVDMVVFDGLSDDEIKNVVFVEVKTGASASLTKRERQIRNAIYGGKVKWVEIRISRAS